MEQLKKKGQCGRHEYLRYRKAIYASVLIISQSRHPSIDCNNLANILMSEEKFKYKTDL